MTKQVGDLLANTANGAQILGAIAHDVEGADALNGRARGRVDKSLLVRSAREVAHSITQRYGFLLQTVGR